MNTKRSSTYVIRTVVIGCAASYLYYLWMSQQQQSSLPPLTPPFVNIYPINTGTLELPDSIALENGREDHSEEITCLSYLIEHPKHGPILFDLGLSKELSKAQYGSLSQHSDFFDRWNIKIDSSFKSLAHYTQTHYNYHADDIQSIIISHYHWDHCGDASDFVNASLIMGQGSKKLRDDVCIACCRKQPGFFGFELPQTQNIIDVEWDENVHIGPFEKCKDLFGDGTLYVVDGAGHVQGHIMAIAKHKNGWILLAGDGVYSSQSYVGDQPRAKGLYKGVPADDDPQAAFDTICKIHEFYHMKNTKVCQAHFPIGQLDDVI